MFAMKEEEALVHEVPTYVILIRGCACNHGPSPQTLELKSADGTSALFVSSQPSCCLPKYEAAAYPLEQQERIIANRRFPQNVSLREALHLAKHYAKAIFNRSTQEPFRQTHFRMPHNLVLWEAFYRLPHTQRAAHLQRYFNIQLSYRALAFT